MGKTIGSQRLRGLDATFKGTDGSWWNLWLIRNARRNLIKTMDYLDHFARFKRKENVEAVERLLSAHTELAKYERAQLGSYYSIYIMGFQTDSNWNIRRLTMLRYGRRS
jgi:hypothetical protein